MILKYKNLLINICIGCSLLISCRSKLTLKDFDSNAWKKDVYGCNGNRQNQLELLLSYKKELKKVSEKDIMEWLGKPDHITIYVRHQKFLHYSISGNPQCNTQAVKRVLTVRISAIEQVSEILIE